MSLSDKYPTKPSTPEATAELPEYKRQLLEWLKRMPESQAMDFVSDALTEDAMLTRIDIAALESVVDELARTSHDPNWEFYQGWLDAIAGARL